MIVISKFGPEPRMQPITTITQDGIPIPYLL